MSAAGTGTADGGAPSRAGVDLWSRSVVGWHVAFALSMALAAVAVVVSTMLSTRGRLVALLLVGALSLAYVALVRRGLADDRRGNGAYLVLAVVTTGVLCSLDPSLSLLLFIAYAQVWLLTPTVTRGALFATALTGSALAGFVAHYAGRLTVGETLREVGPQMVVSLLFSLMLGLWVSRVIDQSRERARIVAELEAARSELEAAYHAQGVMAERERMAREIHDTLAQGFLSVVTLAQAAAYDADPGTVARRLAAIEDVARENLAEARALVAAFSPLDLASTTLREAVERLAERFARETGARVDVDVPDGLGELTREAEVVLLRAAQEALANVRRHADARHVTVRLLREDGTARVEVADDGRGFSPDAPTGGYGLEGMRGRVASVGGRVDVASSPGAGTHVVVRVPAGAGAAAAEGDA